MADIKLTIRGDASEATAALRDTGAAAEEMGGQVEESTGQLDDASESAGGFGDALKAAGMKAKAFADAVAEAAKKGLEQEVSLRAVGKAAKDVAKFVGDSVKEYLKSADANKELAAVARDLEAAETGLKRSIGEATLKIAEQLQIAEAAQGALSWLQTMINGDSDANIAREKRMNELLASQAALRAARINGAANEIEAASKRVLAAQRAMGIAAGQSISPDTQMGAEAQGEAEAQAKAAAAKNAKLAAEAQRHADEMAQLAKKNADDMRALQKSEDESDLLAEKAANKALVAEFKRHSQELWAERDGEDKREDERMKAQQKAYEKQAQELAKQQEQWARAGDAIGGAFVSALSAQLADLARGGEFDAALFVGNILAATIAVAGTAIGSAMGQPALGAALGNLAAMGVQAAATGISNENKAKKTGGLPKYHDGGWVNGGMEQVALLRRDERVLTPQEVGRMGGAASVDSMAAGRGGAMGGIAVTVNAIDAESATRGLERSIGIAYRRAVASGQGPLWRYAVAR